MSRLIEVYGLDDLKKLDETSLPLVIGRDENAHVRLTGDGGTVAFVGESRNHLFLQPAEGSSVQPFFHNDEPVTASVWLKSGDVTRIGDFIIRWHLSGQRVEIRVSRSSAGELIPPVAPPVSHRPAKEKSAAEETLHPAPDSPRQQRVRLHALVIALFILLLACAAFVLLAKPLVVTVTPGPDRLSVSGFPPAVKVGERYLGFPGNYVLRAEKNGYHPLEEDLEITRSGSSYSFALEKMPGLLDVASKPPGATLLLDGVAVGETPLLAVEVPAGIRTFRFQHQRYLPLEKQVEVKGFGEKQSIQVELHPAWAKVNLQSDPTGATLTVDGEEKGVTPLELELLAGKHQLVFSMETFSSLEKELEVVAGKDMTPNIYKLELAPAIVVIVSDPSGATVTVDGMFKGRTPLTIFLEAGVEHDVRLTSAGYRPKSHKLKPGPAEKKEMSINLEPQYGVVFIAGNPADATLYIDGKKHGPATGRLRLTTRPHSLELRAKGYKSVTRTVTPKIAYSQRIEIDLVRSQAAAGPGPSSSARSASAPSSTTTTGLGQKLVLIKPQAFLMGASRQEPGRRANESEHPVKMERPFYITEREVTNKEFRRFQSGHSSGVAGNRSLEIDSHPVVNVGWEDAVRFLNWLSKKDGLPPFYREQNGKMLATDTRGLGYRLPTEAEWAFVARMAGQKERSRYPWKGSFPPKKKVGNFADESARHLLPVVLEGYTDGFTATSPTGTFAANAVGIYDLGGNVAEWCHDYYSAHIGNAAGAEIDPMGPPNGSHRVVRGSSWRDASIAELRLSYRRYSRSPADDIGFRVVRYAR